MITLINTFHNRSITLRDKNGWLSRLRHRGVHRRG